MARPCIAHTANISIVQYLESLRDDCVLRCRRYGYNKAIRSVRSFPRPIRSKQEALALAFVGEKLATVIDVHLCQSQRPVPEKSNALVIHEGAEEGIGAVENKTRGRGRCRGRASRGSSSGPVRSVERVSPSHVKTGAIVMKSVEEDVVGGSQNRNGKDNGRGWGGSALGIRKRTYVPSYRSEGFGIMLALLDFHYEGVGMMRKDEIISSAQRYCDGKFRKPQADRTGLFDEFSIMWKLQEKGYVNAWGNPMWYALTEVGFEKATECRRIDAKARDRTVQQFDDFFVKRIWTDGECSVARGGGCAAPPVHQWGVADAIGRSSTRNANPSAAESKRNEGCGAPPVRGRVVAIPSVVSSGRNMELAVVGSPRSRVYGVSVVREKVAGPSEEPNACDIKSAVEHSLRCGGNVANRCRGSLNPLVQPRNSKAIATSSQRSSSRDNANRRGTDPALEVMTAENLYLAALNADSHTADAGGSTRNQSVGRNREVPGPAGEYALLGKEELGDIEPKPCSLRQRSVMHASSNRIPGDRQVSLGRVGDARVDLPDRLGRRLLYHEGVDQEDSVAAIDLCNRISNTRPLPNSRKRPRSCFEEVELELVRLNGGHADNRRQQRTSSPDDVINIVDDPVIDVADIGVPSNLRDDRPGVIEQPASRIEPALMLEEITDMSARALTTWGNEPECQIVLILDSMERGRRSIGSRADVNTMADMLIQRNVACEIRPLPVGDALFVARFKHGVEVVLDYIIERKTMDDFAGSLCDGRVARQSYVLDHCQIKRRMFIIEGDTSQEFHDRENSSCSENLRILEICHLFHVKKTRDLKDTMSFYFWMYAFLSKDFRGHFLDSVLSGRELFSNWNKRMKKVKNDLTVGNLFCLQICQIKGISIRTAQAILKKGYNTPAALHQAFRNEPDPHKREMLLHDRKAGIRPLASRLLCKFFTSTNYGIEMRQNNGQPLPK